MNSRHPNQITVERGIGEVRVAIWKLVKNTQDPYLARQLWVFSPQGVTPTSKFVCVLPFLDGDAKKHKDLSWFRQEKALHPAGGRVCIILHLGACTGANTSVVRMKMERIRSTTCVWCGVLLYRPSCIRSQASPFIVPRRDLGYMHRRQSRGR